MNSSTTTPKAAQPDAAHSASRKTQPKSRVFFQKKADNPDQKSFFETGLQKKVITGHPGDAYEQEADRMSVLATTRPPGGGRTASPNAGYMPGSTSDAAAPGIQTAPLVGKITPVVQRQAEEGENPDREPAQAAMEADKEPVQAQAENAGGEAEKEPVQAAMEVEKEPVETAVEAEKEPVQAQAEEEKQPVQAQAEGSGSEAEKEPVQAATEAEREPVQVQAKSAGSEAEKEPVQAAKEDEKGPVQADAEAEKEPVQAQAESSGSQAEKEPVQAATEVEREPVQAQADSEGEKEPVQAAAEAEKEPVQAATEGEKEPVQAAAEAEKEPVQAATETEKEPVQAQVAAAATSTSQAPAQVFDQLAAERGRGAPLPDGVRLEMQLNFGADFSGVRIHTDDPAVQLTRMLHAKAFTRGADIYFNQGRYAPGTAEGDLLLAHELTHTIQQGAAGPEQVARAGADKDAPLQRQEDDSSTIQLRPELLLAIKLARGEQGKVNAKKTNADGTRLGWERLSEFFFTAFGEKWAVSESIIKYIQKASDKNGQPKDVMPSWCGIFVWWSYKKAGIPIPDWKLGHSILGWVEPRQPKELPRKGDIAYRQENQHFALVTGVESPETAAGKDFKSIKVATINGNTAGNDNLGGQIEEKWEPMSRWLGFFDPVAKLDMPPAGLVETGVEPDLAPTPDEAAEEVAAADGQVAAAAAAAKPQTDVSSLDEPVATAPQAPAAGEAETPLLPVEPPAPQIEEPAVVEAPNLEGASETAMTGYLESSPSQIAVGQPALAETLDGKIRSEQHAEVENAPELVAQTSGKVEEGITPPDQIPVPGETQIGDGVTGGEPEALQSGAHENFSPTPTNDAAEEKMEDQQEGGFLSWLRDNFKGLMNSIRTTDAGLNTSAGERPNVELQGEADPTRMANQRGDAESQLKGQRDAATTAFKNHPGQANIQPKEIHEGRKTELSGETETKIELAEDQGVKDYAEAPLAGDVRAKADELLQPDLSTHLAEAKNETESAAEQRETDKADEIANAEKETEKINAQADKDQRDIVVTNRQEVAKQQKAGIEQAYAQVNQFNAEADTQQTAANKQIGDKVKESEGKARDELNKAETDAQKEKEDGEKEAAEKKRKLEEEQEEESWWDRAVSAVKSAVKAITKAIDDVFTAVRAAVKEIIEKAKDFVVGLINAARDWVVNKLNEFRDWAKSQVDKYLKEAFPGVAKFINGAIDTVVDVAIDGVNFVADTAIAGVEALAKGLAAALDKILSIYQTALKAAVQIAGAVLTGDFAEALRVAIQAGCDIAGIDSKPIFDFIDRAAAQVISILKNPVKFFNNLMDAVGGGVRLFVKNIRKHLISGLIGWLTGALSEVQITLPESLDFKGILSLVLQIIGLTYANIKAKIIKKYPPSAKVFHLVEKGYEIVQKLITQGPMALWEEIMANLANLKDTVLGAIRDYVITKVVTEAVTWLLGLLNPAGALVKVLKLLFDFVMFLIERFQQIKDFVMSVYAGISAIAAGVLDKAMAAVEEALGRSLPVVISLLASLAGLGGIGKTVKDIIGKVTKPINKVIDAVVDRIIAFAKKLVSKVKAGAKKAKEAVVAVIRWWKHSLSFKSKDGGGHKIFYQGQAQSAQLMVASKAETVSVFLKRKLKETDDPAEKTAIQKAETAFGKVEASEDNIKKKESQKKTAKSKDAKDKINREIDVENKRLRERLVAFSTALEGLQFEAESNLAVKTQVEHTSTASSRTVEAKRLTYLPGNTVGSAPKQDPPGWAHAVKIDTDPKTKQRRKMWVRGHMLNENLHGPGEIWNLVPLMAKTNSQMANSVERDAKKAIAKKGTVIFYRTEVTFHSGGPPVEDFPSNVRVTWGELKRIKGSSPPQFEVKSGTKKSQIFPQPAPPTKAAKIAYNINDIGRDLLVDVTGISHRFGLYVKNELDNRGRFTSYTNFERRMRQNQMDKMGDKALFRSYLEAVKTAGQNGDLEFG